MGRSANEEGSLGGYSTRTEGGKAEECGSQHIWGQALERTGGCGIRYTYGSSGAFQGYVYKNIPKITNRLQIDLHPFMARTEVVAYCKEREVALEVWPFTDHVVGHSG